MANYDFSSESSGSTKYPSFRDEETVDKPRMVPPFIDITKIHNFRGIGGQAFPGSKRIREDFVYRSAEPSPITPEGISALQKLGITIIFDLRSVSEIERNKDTTPVTSIPKTQRIHVPVFGPASNSDHDRRMRYYGEEGTGGFVKAYEEIAEEGANAYRTIFMHIRDRPKEPFLIHCTAGKDRTGIVIALMLSLVGVSDETIGAEYALTETGLAGWIPQIVAVIIKDPALGGDEGKARRMLSAKKQNMVAFMIRLRDRWGSVEGYLKEVLGFSEEDITKIGENIVEPVE